MSENCASIMIVFETHATSLDNERGLASGWFDVDLSPLGVQQARELGQRYATNQFAAIFCADHHRAYRTAVLAFSHRDVPIIRDWRLRECDYGELTRRSVSEIEPAKPAHISTPFPGGESYQQTTARVGDFLRHLAPLYRGSRLMIIGCRATHYGLDYWLNQTPLTQGVTTPFTWQPGWTYSLDSMASKILAQSAGSNIATGVPGRRWRTR